MAAFNNTGEICFAGTRLFVQRRIHDEVLERRSALSRTLRVGRGTDPQAAGRRSRRRVFGDVRNDMTIAQEEIFGPVTSVIPSDDADEGLRLANQIDYGFGRAV